MNWPKPIICILLTFGLATATAQQDLMQYIGNSTPQAMYVNPAFAPDARMHIGLPFMSSVSLQHSNFIFSPREIFENTDQGVVFKTDEYLSLIKDRNTTSVDFAVDVLSFGLRVKKNYFSLSVREKLMASVSLPGDLLRFPVLGNGDFETTGGVLDFSDLSIDFTHHVEYGFGWQTTLGEKTEIGAKAKLLFGRENVRTNRSDIRWETDPITYAFSFTGGLDMSTSGVSYLLDSIDSNGFLENGEVTRYLLEFRNAGMGIDLGINHQMTEKLSLSAAIIDLGFINWSNGNRNYQTSGEEFVFTGIELTEGIIGADSAFSDSLAASVDGIVTSLNQAYELREDTESYRTGLNTRYYVGAEYKLFENDASSGTAGLLFQSAFYNGEMTPTVSASYTQTVGEWLTASLAYSVMKEDAKNIGIGLAFNRQPMQFYVSMDNVFALDFSEIKTNADDEASGYPSNSATMTLHFGLNLLFGEKLKEVSDQDAKY